jgi:hypothetical protein
MALSKSSREVYKGKRAVSMFSNRGEAEHALTELKNAGFKMEKVSVIAKDASHEPEIADIAMQELIDSKVDEGAATGAMTGATMGGITGLIVGLGLLTIPGVGPILLVGEIASTLATTAVGAGIGAAAGGLLGALMSLGIPEEQARVYSKGLSGGDYLVIIDGTEEEIHHAENLLRRGGLQDFAIYNAPDITGTCTDNLNPMNHHESPVTIIDSRNTNL